MIVFVDGNIDTVDPTYVVMDIGGIGYEIKISLNTYASIKSLKTTRLHTYFHVKEDAQTLYGFHEQAEKKRFQDLISINGVGPSTGLMILSSLSPEELQSAIVNDDVNTIKGVKGIGLKTAQRIVLELKDKMKKEGILEKSIENAIIPNNTLKQEALSALTTLGISKQAGEKTVDQILKANGPDIKLEELIKLALKRA
ncbi:MAG: Holliday junction branch migration protein RuvA [Cyclobacteriaceae bacterium]|nr:Holliday junction branch migration protein RuvA [Cyclobacteriaceae bacterium HetDA_MAG_MS6]